MLDTVPGSLEEIVDNVHIDTDGIIGTVYMDYRFLVDGKPANEGRGVETWQLVHTDEGWKISAMLYRG